MDWIFENIKWIFSGIGVVVIAGFFKLFRAMKKEKSNKIPEKEPPQSSSQGDDIQINAAGDVVFAKDSSFVTYKVTKIKNSSDIVIGDNDATIGCLSDEVILEDLLKPRLPQRFFATQIIGGPEATGPSPKLLVGKKYECVFSIKANAYSKGVAVEIPPKDLAAMRGREVLVMCGGEGLELRNSCASLKIGGDFTSAEASVSFNAIKPGPCNLELHLLLDNNLVSAIKYDFIACTYLALISDAPVTEKVCPLPTAENCNRLSNKALHIWVSGGPDNMLMLKTVWGVVNEELIPLKPEARQQLEEKKQSFLRRYAKNIRYCAISLKTDEANKFLSDLKELGEFIFRTLFILPGRPGLRKLGEGMRDLFRQKHPLPIQIVPGTEHLPWMFLSDGEGAIGLRHGVEYLLSGSSGFTDLDLMRKPQRLVCGLAQVLEDVKIDNDKSVLELQREILAKLRNDGYTVSIANDETQWLQELRTPADVIYAYCHGSSGDGDPYLWMTKRENAIFGSTIDSGSAINWSHNPLVILAACTSGAIDPFLAMGLSNSFMSRGVKGIIATEGWVPTIFASLFMRDFFDEFFLKGGRPVGEVLFDLRKRFQEEMNNPWGILFTQFCRSEITVINH